MITKTKILYVDDEETNLQLFKYNFSKKYDVLICSNGFEGLSVLEMHPDIKVVISDMKMPNLTGIEFITKAKIKFPDKKYFILTGYDITREIKNALDTNLIVRYFRKPFNMEEINSEISKFI